MSADISFGALTFNGDFTPPGATPDYSLQWISCPMGATKREMADFKFFGIDGILSVDGGANPRVWTLSGLIVGADAAAIAAAEDAIYAEQDGTVDTFTRWGTPITGVELLEFTPGQMKMGQYAYEWFTITFRQL
jgi:hypothetical protein